MAITLSTAEARKNFAHIINKVAYGDESVILTRRGKEVAALVSLKELELLQRLEDLIDTEDAQKALEEPGDNIPAHEFWEKAGL